MKCSLCGAELVNGNNTCPSCGALNMAFSQAAAPQNTPQETPVVDNQQPTVVPQTENIETFTPTPDDGVEVLDMPAKAEESKEGEVIDSSTSGFVDLDEGEAEVVQASEDMQAPKLDVNQENIEANAQDISSSSEVSTYDPTQAVPEDVTDDAMPKEAGLNFALPEIKEAAEDTQGMNIPSIETKGETVGTESAPVKEKFSLKIFRKKTLPRNVVLILLGVIFVIGILLGSLLFGKKVYSPAMSNYTNKKTEVTDHVADGKNNITYNGKFIYKIPQKYDFDKRENGVVIYDENDQFRISLRAVNGSYELIANAKESIKLTLENIGIRVSKLIETTVGETNYIVVEASSQVNSRMYAFREGMYGYIYYVEIVTADNNYDVGLLDIANDILNNLEYNDKYSFMESISYEDVAAVVTTAADAKNNA